jgi:hypothetical protein
MVEGDQITLYPVRAVRKYPDMSGIPAEELTPEWIRREEEANKDTRRGISASTPTQAIKRIKK